MSFERNIWADDLDPAKAALERAWTALGRDYLYALHLETHRLLELPPLPRASVEAVYQMSVGGVIAKADDAPIERALRYSNALRRFRELRRAGRVPAEHARHLAAILADKWYGEYRLHTRAQARAVRTWLAGFLRAKTRAPRPATPPVTWQEAKAVYRLDDTLANSIQWAQAHAAEHVTSLKERARHALAETLLAAQAEGTTQPLTVASNLLTKMGTLNRDWRTIAITEQAMNHAHGELAGLIGQKVEWIAAADACPHCKQFAGQIFEVVSPDAPHKDFWRHVWAGKSNVGRSFAPRTRDGRTRTREELAGPAIPAHPSCRCRWRRVLQKPAADPRLLAYLRTTMAP